jgi:hypothetical protein
VLPAKPAETVNSVDVKVVGHAPGTSEDMLNVREEHADESLFVTETV